MGNISTYSDIFRSEAVGELTEQARTLIRGNRIITTKMAVMVLTTTSNNVIFFLLCNRLLTAEITSL